MFVQSQHYTAEDKEMMIDQQVIGVHKTDSLMKAFLSLLDGLGGIP